MEISNIELALIIAGIRRTIHYRNKSNLDNAEYQKLIDKLISEQVRRDTLEPSE